jgi:hypothetical protein
METDQSVRKLANACGTPGAEPNEGPSGNKQEGACFRWLEFAAFVALSTAIYAISVECSSYRTVLAGDNLHPGLFSEVVTLWVLWAGTFVLFVPLLAVVTLSMCLGLRRAAQAIGFSGWLILFFLLTVDLILETLNGTHLGDWLPYLYDILQAPERNQAQYVGSGIGLEALKVAVTLVIGGWGLMALTRWAGKKLRSRFGWLDSLQGTAAAGLCIFALAAGSVPALGSLDSPELVGRLKLILPINVDFLENFHTDASSQTSRVVFKNRTTEDLDLANYYLLGRGGVSIPLEGKMPKGGQTSLVLRADQVSQGQFFFVDRDGRLTHRLRLEPDPEVIKLVVSNEGKISDSPATSVTSALDTVRDRYLEDAVNPKPADSEAIVRKPSLPNIILIALESLQYTAISPDLTKRLWAWSAKGLRLERHYSASNCSHLSLFSLLYGRNGLGYAASLDRHIRPQLCASLKGSGYQSTFVTSTECRQFQRMHEYLNETSFDHVEWMGGGSWDDFRAWPDADRRVFAEIRKIASTELEKPQFVFAFLVSSHYPYICPKEFEKHKPCGEQVSIENVVLNPNLTKEMLVNRYRNSISFLEDELMKLIEALNPERNIIIVTGDHGESMGEDGVLSHNSRASEIQTRVPFIMVGPGVEPRRITISSSHMDVLPTLLHAVAGQTVPIRNCHGRDLLADKVEDTGIAITPLLGSYVVFVRGDDRFLIRADLKRGRPPSISFRGLIDERGLPKGLVPTRQSRFH